VTDTSGIERSRPVVQEAKLEGHVEIDLPSKQEGIVLGDEIARHVAEDILRLVDGHDECGPGSGGDRDV